jgi:carboxyl-terminal processing protease
MNGMFKTLDKYSYFTPAAGKKDYNDLLDNNYEGIGLISSPSDDKKSIEIIYPLLDSPAYQAGLRSGDKVLAVNGKNLTENQVEEFSALIKSLRDSEIEMTILPLDKTEPIKITIQTAPLNIDSVEGDSIDSDGGRNFILENDNEIGYIRITSFSRRTADEFGDALRQLYTKQARGLILDLRGNPGGYVNISVEIAKMLLQSVDNTKIIVSTKYKDGRIKKNYYGNEKSQICSLPIVALIDGETASASEILAAALQDYKRAVIVGSRSFGKGVVQEIYDLPANSGAFQLTGVSYWRPSNKNIHKYENATENDEWGVVPDFKCKLELQKWRTRAIDSIRTRRANTVCENRDLYLNSYIKNIEQEIEKLRIEFNKLNKSEKNENNSTENNSEKNNPDNSAKNNNTKNESNGDSAQENNIPFKLQGESPYFDPQLDKAIEILKRLISGESVLEVTESKE